jgi:hypothetical protein
MYGLFGAVIWAGYGVASYGWVMLKGYNVPAAKWFTPVGTFQWSSDPGFVPKGKVFPGQAPGSGSGNTTSGTTSTAPAPSQGSGVAAGAAGALKDIGNALKDLAIGKLP